MHEFADGGDGYRGLKSDWTNKQDEETQTATEIRGREGCSYPEMHTNEGGTMGQFACLLARPVQGIYMIRVCGNTMYTM